MNQWFRDFTSGSSWAIMCTIVVVLTLGAIKYADMLSDINSNSGILNSRKSSVVKLYALEKKVLVIEGVYEYRVKSLEDRVRDLEERMYERSRKNDDRVLVHPLESRERILTLL